MRKQSLILLSAVLLTGSCAKRVPERASAVRGTPHVSWVIMSGDRDNPDEDFVCQSEPRNDCIVPASRPGAQRFSDVHVYYHGAGTETKYTGSFRIGYFEGAAESQDVQTNITVKKTESITNQSVTGIVTGTPGQYAVTFVLEAAPADAGTSQSIREDVPVTVR